MNSTAKHRLAEPSASLFKRCLVLPIAVLLASCATDHYPINPRLAHVDNSRGYRLQRFLATDSQDALFMQVAISGGGARASALGLGVLEALRETTVLPLGQRKQLIDELDVLTGVSGGSILAAYIGLHGLKALDQFPQDFLRRPMQAAFMSRVLSVPSLWKIQSPRWGRGDVFAEFLDEELFKGASFADLSLRPRKPFVIINASDMSTGTQFEFTQERFDYLCSDLDGVSLARAVAASSAVPIALSPIAMWNHNDSTSHGGCGGPETNLLAPTVGSGFNASARLAELESFRAVKDGKLKRPFVHLLDGGLSDNVGAFGPADALLSLGGVRSDANLWMYRNLRWVVQVVVNAEGSVARPEDHSADVPGPVRTALALADIPIRRNSNAALLIKRALLEGWQSEVQAARARGEFDIFPLDTRFYLIEVDLAESPHELVRERLKAIPTTLHLPEEDVKLLREQGATALRESPDFQRLINDLNR